MGQSYRDLIAWQKSIDLVAEIYPLTRPFPKDELYGRVSQLRRAVISVPSNLAEGQGRKSPAEFRHFLHTSSGSLMEVETQVTIARILGYITPQCETALLHKTNEIGRIIHGLLTSLAL
jgi:four helix bundle protein